MARGIAFEAGGTPRLLRFDFNALCRIEEALGCTASAAFARQHPDHGGPHMREVRTILGSALGGAIPAEKVGDIIDEVGFARVLEMINDAMALAFPEPDRSAGPADAAGNAAGTAV